MTEQRPRMQSRAEVVPLRQGDAVVRGPPPAGAGQRGIYRVNLRHGVSRVRRANGTHSASSSTMRSE